MNYGLTRATLHPPTYTPEVSEHLPSRVDQRINLKRCFRGAAHPKLFDLLFRKDRSSWLVDVLI